jgi:uncharacterized repeat protein (TIGR01451 family)
MNLHSIFLVGVAAFVGGCTTPNLERIATVQSRADALYAYGGVPTFPVSSELVEVSIYAPVHHQREYQTLPIEREKTKPVVNAQPTKPAASVPTKSVANEPTLLADADTQKQTASTKTRESAAQTKEKPLESAEPTEVRKETVATSEQPATQIEKPQAADVRQQTVAADTRVSERQPTFHKKVSKDHVTVGEKFEFTMDFQNSTPVDLASVQLNDPVDTRLKIFSDQIQVKPNFKHHVSVGNGEVVVRFTKELKRGKRVRVTVPVMFPVTSAAAAQ